ncbi:unnamed protein product [Rotaria sp. Silwood2]|nr:unnamed protein product [Rotaria sp. Silwood2]CAF3033613.1 unnamed protein product [Rotaria sp. Silwood2]CAF3217129.1 unnamed protein product [Rotaria sp. Silwood2]CAF4213224.1 unnamed protein product [Rotaria sp. Silwood2]CAF4239336.1 unnamed protein product [Rotaria sp. Silwood2]
MSRLCSIKSCTRISRWLCDCCRQNLCLQHLNEHNALLISQLNPLTDEINALGDRLKTLTIQKTIVNNLEKLEQWRQDCYKAIDCLFEQKCQELHQLVNEKVGQQREELNQIHLKITELINSQEATRQDIELLASIIRQIETNMNELEETCFAINISPLLIDDTLISIENPTEYELDLSTLSPAYRTIHYPKGSFISLTGNDRYLLIHRYPNLCLLDREMNIVKQTLWSNGEIRDSCWSSTLDQFIILGKKDIFLINESTMSIENVQTVEERYWLSCTCSDTVLFACTNERASSVLEFTLFPSIEFTREWKYPVTCTDDEMIDDIVYSTGNIALTVKNVIEKSVRIELRYAKTFYRIWTLQLDIRYFKTIPFRCCLLTCNEWLIVDHETGRLFHIRKDGKIKKIISYYSSPYRAFLLDSNKLAVSTMDGVNLRTLQ